MDARTLLHLLDRTADAVADAVGRDRRDRPSDQRDKGGRPGQYRIDLVADEAALEVLVPSGVGVLSEESGLDDRGSPVVVVIDPVDGSTNASRGIPWYATSLCAVDDDGPLAAVVANLATGERYRATRGGGATRDDVPIEPSAVTGLTGALVVLNGYSPEYLRWRQYRALGASALDLCSVADGRVDGTIDCTDSALGPWDYMGAMLVLTEAGGHVADAEGRDLVELTHATRRTPVSAGSEELLGELLAARRRMPEW